MVRAGVAAHDDDRRLVEKLRAGDEAAFASIVERNHSTLLRIARLYVGNAALAEEVVQETWLAVLEGLSRFEGRCTFRTWLFRILSNRARDRGRRERRCVPFSQLVANELANAGSAVPAHRFVGPEEPRWRGHWTSAVGDWSTDAEERLLSTETMSHVRAALDRLPPSQREVVRLRDVEGWTAEEVCSALRLTRPNQRVLLHRGRSRIRLALERYFDG